jgi:tetratricopeptide (TPR) repeat protein
LGYALALSGRISDALTLLERTVGQAPFTRLTSRRLNAAWVGEVYMRAGRLADTHTLAMQALALAREHRERGAEAWTLRLLGDIAMRRNPPETEPAERHYREALALAERLGMCPLQAHCHRGLGMLYGKLGWQEQAHKELSTAIEMYRTMTMTFWLPEAEATLMQGQAR